MAPRYMPPTSLSLCETPQHVEEKKERSSLGLDLCWAEISKTSEQSSRVHHTGMASIGSNEAITTNAMGVETQHRDRVASLT